MGDENKEPILILRVPENIRGKKIQDIDSVVGPLKEGEVLRVSKLMKKALLHHGIAIPYYIRKSQ